MNLAAMTDPIRSTFAGVIRWKLKLCRLRKGRGNTDPPGPAPEGRNDLREPLAILCALSAAVSRILCRGCCRAPRRVVEPRVTAGRAGGFMQASDTGSMPSVRFCGMMTSFRNASSLHPSSRRYTRSRELLRASTSLSAGRHRQTTTCLPWPSRAPARRLTLRPATGSWKFLCSGPASRSWPAR